MRKREIDNSFGQYIRRLRVQACLSMGHCARAFDVSVCYWSNVENCQKPPFPVNGKVDYRKLADMLNTDYNDLIRRGTGGSEARAQLIAMVQQASDEEVMNLLAKLAD